MAHSLYHRSVWNEQSSEQRLEWLKQLEQQLPAGFVLQRLETFNRYGQTMEIGIFTYEDCEFVYVPGDTVTLGWDQWPLELDQASRDDLEAGLSELDLEVDEAGPMIRQQMSPMRQIDVAAMLVERQTHSVGWERYEPEELDPQEDDDILEALERFRAASHSSYEIDQTCLLERDGEQVKLYLFDESEDVQEWTEEHLSAPFALLTEDEWEYVYGGGCRTLFPWGNSFDYTMNVRHFGDLTEYQTANDAESEAAANDVPSTSNRQTRLYDLELPNAFGLYFAGDPYQYELTLQADGQELDKGGDGGSAICGGVGVMLSYLPVATYYRNPYQEDLDWSERIGYMRYRRIVRLEDQ
ncbi:hypothetical protein [Paenibacillus kandeliae]|uniref:hypothetical protein n=1 Tax=Paenibacillus kandeliae TaxID=3231269 RepID=UPI003459F6AF